MGVTGSGKTFTMANVIQHVQRPTLVMSHNKTLAAQLYSRVQGVLPPQRRPLFRQLLRLLPARGVHPAARHLHRERRLDQPADRPAAAGGHQRPGQPPRRDHRGQRLVHLRPGLARGLSRDDGRPERRARRSIATSVLAKLVDIQYERNDIEFQPGKFRVRGDCVEVWPTYEEFAFRVEFWGDEVEQLSLINPTSGEVHRAARAAVHLSLPSTSSCPRSGSHAAVDEIKRELEERLEQFKEQGKLLEAHRLSARTRFDMEMMQEVGYCPGIENYSRPLSGPPAGLAAGHAVQLLSRRFPAVRRRVARHACRRSAACTPATTTAR